MSSEIVPFREGRDTPSAEPHDTGKGKAAVVEVSADSDAIRRGRLGAMEEGIRPFDLLGLRSVEIPRVEVDVIGGNHDIRHFLPPEKGPKYTTHLNPTPEYLKPLLEKIKEPSVLQLRGCDQLFIREASPFPFEKFKTLTCLEIYDVSNLTTLPEKTISEMTQLEALNLSHLPIQQIQDDFFYKVIHLRSLTLKDCPNIHSLPKLAQMTALEYLELSHLLIETLPEGSFSDLKKLERVILRGCSKLSSLPSIQPLKKLKVLDLSHCTALQEMEPLDEHEFYLLWKLDLSYTALHSTSTLGKTSFVTHLFLRDAKVIKFEGLPLFSLKVLDVSGAQNMKDLGLVKGSKQLEALDLSRTGIESIDFISGLVKLRYLILKECTRLQKLPAMEKLTHLEVLDISGCEILGDLPENISSLKRLKELNLSGCSGLRELIPGLFDKMTCLEKLDISKTNINHLPSFANLTNLRTLNLSQTSLEEVPNLSNLVNRKDFFFADCQTLKSVPTGLQTLANLDLAPPGSGDIDFIHSSRMENLHSTCRLDGRISKPNEFHLVSTFISSSGFDLFKILFDQIVGLILNPPTQQPDTISTPTTAIIDGNNSASNTIFTTNVAACDICSQTVKRRSRRVLADLKYILDNVGLLESCCNCTSAEELMDDLTDAAIHLSPFDFGPDSANFYALLQTVAKLKVLVPPKQVDALEKNEEEKKKKKKKKKKKAKFMKRSMNTEEGVVDTGKNSWLQSRLLDENMHDPSPVYDSLTDIQKKCLLYFAVFPSSISVKGRSLIQLWYSEGFIDTQNEELNLDPAECSNPNPEGIGTSINPGVARNYANRDSLQVSTTKGVENPATIEEIGRKILEVLVKKRFIRRVQYGNELGFYLMQSHVHTFVTTHAKIDCFFDLNGKNGKLTPHFTGSQRAKEDRLLKSQDKIPSSTNLLVKYSNSSQKLGSFETVGTLFHVDDAIVDIRAEWFSKMSNLSVLHLGRWGYHKEKPPIEVVDLKFLEELKNMKQLRLLNLEGFSTITKLPNSVCKLSNLRILNLRDCSYLEGLPVGIGSLKNLTHLDLTNCHVLYKLPKGLRFLSKLEVLKGFVITYQLGGRQHRNVCTLRDLLKLENLRKLNLVVNKDKFPENKDLEVFKEMNNLCNLKITWEKNYNNDH